MISRFILTVALVYLVGTSVRAAEAKTKIVLIGHKHDHPPGTHMYLEVCEMLAKCLNQSHNIEAVVSDGWPTDPNVLKGVKAIVLYSSPGGNILLDESHREQAEKLMKDGVGFTAIHWATDAKPELGPAYQQILGGWFNNSFSALNVTTARLQQTDSSHPICHGWKEYDHHEEYYLNVKFLSEAKPVLKVSINGQDQVVGWVYERPNSRGGRSFGTTLGHFYDNFKIEAFRRAIVNGILWTAHQRVPKEGAPCRITDEEKQP